MTRLHTMSDDNLNGNFDQFNNTDLKSVHHDRLLENVIEEPGYEGNGNNFDIDNSSEKLNLRKRYT